MPHCTLTYIVVVVVYTKSRRVPIGSHKIVRLQTVPRGCGVVAPERSGRLANSICDRVSVLNTYSVVRFRPKLNINFISPDGPRDYGVNVVYNSVIIIFRLYYTEHVVIILIKLSNDWYYAYHNRPKRNILETINQSPWTHIPLDMKTVFTVAVTHNPKYITTFADRQPLTAVAYRRGGGG